MEDNTNDLPEKKYPESAMATDPGEKKDGEPSRNDPMLAGVYAGPAQMAEAQPIGFVYAGPGYDPSGPVGMMSIMAQMSDDQQGASMLMAYAGPPPELSHLGMRAAVMGPDSAMASQYSDQGKNYRFCPNCGSVAAKTAHFCTECGTRLEG